MARLYERILVLVLLTVSALEGIVLLEQRSTLAATESQMKTRQPSIVDSHGIAKISLSVNDDGTPTFIMHSGRPEGEIALSIDSNGNASLHLDTENTRMLLLNEQGNEAAFLVEIGPGGPGAALIVNDESSGLSFSRPEGSSAGLEMNSSAAMLTLSSGSQDRRLELGFNELDSFINLSNENQFADLVCSDSWARLNTSVTQEASKKK